MHASEGGRPAQTGPGGPLGGVALSSRELHVLHLIAHGLSNQEIADAVFLSINSVKTYIRSAYRKIGVTRRAQAVVWALRHGLDGGEHATYDVPGLALGKDDRPSRPLVRPAE